MRPSPTASSEYSQARTHSPCSGTVPLSRMPNVATAIAATDTPLRTGITPSSTSARRRVR